MGKGDRRSKRGKIFRGTYGKRRPKPAEDRKKAKAAETAAAAVTLDQAGAMPIHCRLAWNCQDDLCGLSSIV